MKTKDYPHTKMMTLKEWKDKDNALSGFVKLKNK